MQKMNNATEKTLPDRLNALDHALTRLEEAINAPCDSERFVIDATIQRFEFTIELFWKVLRKCVLAEGHIANSPKEALKKAYQLNWVEDETLWLQMFQDRNLSSHTYNEARADDIYTHIKKYTPYLRKTFSFLKKNFS